LRKLDNQPIAIQVASDDGGLGFQGKTCGDYGAIILDAVEAIDAAAQEEIFLSNKGYLH
jgi:hypothetical protein